MGVNRMEDDSLNYHKPNDRRETVLLRKGS